MNRPSCTIAFMSTCCFLLACQEQPLTLARANELIVQHKGLLRAIVGDPDLWG